jgi:hypothetical protein
MTTFSTPPLPPRCEAVYPGREAVQCALPIGHADDHRSAYHGEAAVRWPRPAVEVLGSGRVNMAERFAQRPVSLQHDACGARLTVSHGGPGWTAVCALGPHDFQTMHRSADGMMWRASAFPPTVPPAGPLARSVTDGIVRHLESMTAVFGELRDALCAGCREVAHSSNPEDGADLEIVPGCPVHGETAVLRRALDWSGRQYARLCAALGPEFVGPFAADATEAALKCIDTATKLDGVLADAGADSSTGLRAVTDLSGQRDAAREHARNAENALARIADMARQSLAAASDNRAAALAHALGRIIAVTEETDR